MKTIKRFLIIAFLFGCIHSLQAIETKISLSQLPEKAQTFLKKNFEGQTPDYILMDKEITSVEYTVRFQNGSKVEFNNKGKWKKVEGSSVSPSILPKSIVDYLTKNYKNSRIIKVEKEKGYDIELSNDLELKFNSKGKFIRIDS